MDRFARRSGPVTDRLHPRIYAIIAGLALWFVFSAWWFFGGAGYIELALAVMTGVFVMALGIPFTLWQAGVKARKRDAAQETTEEHPASEQPAESLGTWIEGQFDTWTGQQTSATAAVEILLPIAAVALGIMAMGIVFHIVVHLAATGGIYPPASAELKIFTSLGQGLPSSVRRRPRP